MRLNCCFSSHPMGDISQNKSSGQIAYSVGFAWQYTNFYPYYRWQSARRQRSRYPYSRARSFLYNGSRLHRFQTSLYNAQYRSIFSDSCKIKYTVQTSLFSQNRHLRWSDLRSDNRATMMRQIKTLNIHHGTG